MEKTETFKQKGWTHTILMALVGVPIIVILFAGCAVAFACMAAVVAIAGVPFVILYRDQIEVGPNGVSLFGRGVGVHRIDLDEKG